MEEFRERKHTFATRLGVLGIYVKNALKVMIICLILWIPLVSHFAAARLYKVANYEGTDIDLRDFVDSMTCYWLWHSLSDYDTLDLLKQVSLNGKMCDVKVAGLDGTLCKLSDFMKKGRPLVINFGSCT